MSTRCLLIPGRNTCINDPFMADPISRLLKQLTKLGIKEAAFARSIGESIQTFQNWKTRGSIPTRKIPKVAKAAKLSPHDLDPIFAGETRPEHRNSNTTTGPKLGGRVPLISWVKAGNWDEETEGPEEWHQPPGPAGKNAYALRVRGDSMEPEFLENDIITVDPDKEAKNGDYVVVRLDDYNETTFKQLIVDGGKRYLKPLNGRYPIIELYSSATFCGVVVYKSKAY